MDRSPAFSVCQWNIPSAFYFFEIKKKSEPVPYRNQVRISPVWWSIGESNPWPLQCECSALPTALIPHIAGLSTSDGYYSKPSLQLQGFFENPLCLCLGRKHGQSDALLLHIHIHNPHLHHIPHLDHFRGMLDKAGRHPADMHKAILMDADIHKNAKIDHITHCAGQYHAGL